MTLLQFRNVNKLTTVTKLPTPSPCSDTEPYRFFPTKLPPTQTCQAEPILFGSLNITHITSGIRTKNPWLTTIPPDTRTIEIKCMEDSIVAVKQDSCQKYEQLVDILKRQSLKLDQTIENQGAQINYIRHIMGTMAQQIEFTLLKLSQAPGSFSHNTKRPIPSQEGVEFRNKEPREDRMSSYKQDPLEELMELKQQGELEEYIQDFDILWNKAEGEIVLLKGENPPKFQTIEIKQLSSLVGNQVQVADYFLCSLMTVEDGEKEATGTRTNTTMFPDIKDTDLSGDGRLRWPLMGHSGGGSVGAVCLSCSLRLLKWSAVREWTDGRSVSYWVSSDGSVIVAVVLATVTRGQMEGGPGSVADGEEEEGNRGRYLVCFGAEGRWVAGLWKWDEGLGWGKRRLERLVSGLCRRRVNG
uniref:Uncharacterized protein n=1 Tax=Populus alba TaxID=43335 RepID=A0A4U5Q7J5_POPAL|nr:hypothetical protein D5086_0000129610 [Populus alba]